MLAESSTLPLGAVVLLSDGADNSGGIDLETISQIRRQRIPVHTIGFGREKSDQRSRNQGRRGAAARAGRFAAERAGHLPAERLSGQKAQLTVRDGEKVLASQEITLKADGAPQTESRAVQRRRRGRRRRCSRRRSAARRGESATTTP